MTRTIASSILPLVLALAACGTSSTEPTSAARSAPGTAASTTTDPYSLPGKASVTPRLATTSAAAHTTGNTVVFEVTNTGLGPGEYSVSCLAGGDVTRCEVSATMVSIAGGASVPVTVTYATGAPGSGTASLLASSSLGTDVGHYYVTVTGTTSTKPKKSK